MKRLKRPEAPPCLARHDPRHQRWGELDPDCKRAVRARLDDEMQRGLCAYCERELGAGAHIEHLARRRDFPRRTFDWRNLFLSCGDRTTCGTYKDRRGGPPYDPDALVDPAVHDPEDDLAFRETGMVEPHRGATGERRQRARATIDVLHLDCGPLRDRRALALKHYRQREPGLMEALIDWPPDDRRAFIEGELAAIEAGGEACSASVRAFLRKALPGGAPEHGASSDPSARG